jgi:hypothetical protein
MKIKRKVCLNEKNCNYYLRFQMWSRDCLEENPILSGRLGQVFHQILKERLQLEMMRKSLLNQRINNSLFFSLYIPLFIQTFVYIL